MSKAAPWFDSTPAPDVRVLTQDELLDLWETNRNNLQGQVAADEVMKRLNTARKETNRD